MLNLHNIVRGVITSLHPDEEVNVYHSIGQVNQYGKIIAKYELPPQLMMMQIQSVDDEKTELDDKWPKSSVTREAWLYAPEGETVTSPLDRPIARQGDMLQRANGTWWQVVGLKQDFIRSGWISIIISAQINPPDLSASEEVIQ